ncbi:MAG: hypothetical protein QOG36_413 [Actinomycetota bacterium]|nr:hypothetical protein [Actinomycetota bacterium]
MPMLRSKHATDASSERTTVREDGDLLLVESPTAEEALDRLSSLLGPDVEIVAAGKVARGGVGGFFAREMVQLSARNPPRPAPAAPPRLASAVPAAPAAPASIGLAESAMASLLNGSGRPAAAPRSSQPEAPALYAATEMPAHLRALLSERMAEPAAPAAPPEGEPTFGEALRRQLGIEAPTPPGDGNEPADSRVPAEPQMAPAEPPSPVPPRLTVLDASWGFPLLNDPLAQEGPAQLAPTDVPLSEAASPLLDTTPAAEPAVVLAPLFGMPRAQPAPEPAPVPSPVLFDPLPDLVPDLAPDLGSSAPGDAPGTGGVAWSADELVRLGLPFSFIRPLLDARPGDDLAWIRGLAASVRTLCTPLPDGDVALVGALAGQLAKPLRLEALHRPDRGPKRGSICCSIQDDADSRRWFERVRRDRWTHLVVGPLDAKAFLDLHPKAVSWVGADALLGALRLATELGVPLGYFKPDDAGRALRATPIEVALAVRALVARR